MAASFVHAQSSARHFKAGTPADYLDIHEWIDQFKRSTADVRHRSFLHNSQGPWMAQDVFGVTRDVMGWDGEMKTLTVREIVESHIMQDLGWIPSPADWADCMDCKVWMGGARNKYIGREDMLEDVVSTPNPTRGGTDD